MEEQAHKIELLTKELEKMGNSSEIQQLLMKMEERIAKKEDEIKLRKASKFNRDKKDYEMGSQEAHLEKKQRQTTMSGLISSMEDQTIRTLWHGKFNFW
ncbi:hypothetical protein NDU88_010058 [Pleurodeles waltl]|uniref:Uncharacterized protein n=1 Tax=Pleurodeles waltl TaxID=8319 RepID=A0AAV7RYE7_PLEWA|nr:hypothetical protein NDU88_010058 [Pleurodeles waltl]